MRHIIAIVYIDGQRLLTTSDDKCETALCPTNTDL
jgi:hypothetical protein